MYTARINKLDRHFVPKDFIITTWDKLEPYFKDLLDRKISTSQELEEWLKDMSELEAVVSEDACWCYINKTSNTENKTLEQAFNFFCFEIQPKIQPYADALNKKLVNSPLTGELETEKYFTYLRSVRKNIELFREENIPLQSELAVMQQQYAVISGKMMVEVNGQQYTLQQAAKFLESPE